MKIEREKKLSVLQNQEYKGEDEAKIFKTKTSINRLQSLITVTSQAVSTTSTAIIGLRDSDLVPQLVELCHGYVSSAITLLFSLLQTPNSSSSSTLGLGIRVCSYGYPAFTHSRDLNRLIKDPLVSLIAENPNSRIRPLDH